LTQSHIHLYSDKQKTVYLRSINTQWTKIEYLSDENNKSKTILRFTKNCCSEEFLVKSQETLAKIQPHLRRLAINKDFETRFEVNKWLGQGNFGEVHMVTNKVRKERFAAKIYDLRPLAKEASMKWQTMRNCIKNEIKILRALAYTSNSENFLTVYEVHEVSGLIILVVDLIDGGELLTPLKKDQKFEDQEIWRIMTQLALTLDTLNQLKIVHRDLKPQNVLWKFSDKNFLENQIVICDFGISCFEKLCKGSNKDSDCFLKSAGTRGYMAPEILVQCDNGVAAGEFVLECSGDIYSLGILFYYLLTLGLPWKENRKDDVVTQNMKSNIDFSDGNRDLRGVAGGARKLLEWMLQPEPENRITSQELILVLDQLAEDGPCFSSSPLSNGSGRVNSSFGFCVKNGSQDFVDILDSRKERDAKRPVNKMASVTYLPGETEFIVPDLEKPSKLERRASIAILEKPSKFGRRASITSPKKI
jgi:calcium/calmodulin-dependent protein kinase I